MQVILQEDVLHRLITLLSTKFQKDMSGYMFLTESFDNFPPDFSRLEGYLHSEKIKFQKQGVSLGSMMELPSSFLFQGDCGRFPGGLYFIYPETDKEVIFYFFIYANEDRRIVPRYIMCYKDESTLDVLLAGLRQYSAAVRRSDTKIHVFDGRDIEMPKVSWDEVILPPNVKDDIRHNVESFMSGEHAYRTLGIPYKRGFLLTGPPGNGKTMILKVIAGNYPEWKSIYFRRVVQSDNEDLDRLFEMAEDLAPSILYFEDIDTLFQGSITLSHFLNKLDGFEQRNGTLILATTNHPEEIDEALTSRPSRFDRVWVIGNPGYECRRSFLEKCFQNLSCDFLDNLAEDTDGFSMAYLKELYIASSMLAINKGFESPDEHGIMESLALLSSQMQGAQKRFLGVSNTRKVGFGL